MWEWGRTAAEYAAAAAWTRPRATATPTITDPDYRDAGVPVATESEATGYAALTESADDAMGVSDAGAMRGLDLVLAR